VFDLAGDPSESAPIADAAKVAELDALARAWERGIAASQVNESQCLPASAPPARLHRVAAAGCLAASATREHAPLVASAACAPGALNQWLVALDGGLTLAGGGGGANATATWCLHHDNRAAKPCAAGTPVWLGSVCGQDDIVLDAAAGTLRQPACPGKCAGVVTDGSLALQECSAAAATGWAVLGGGARGRYVQPRD
jgi:hypothetical protein